MMKKISLQHGAVPLLIVLVLGILSACSNLLNRPDPVRSPGEGLVQISLVTAEEDAVFPSARTALPRPADLYCTLVFTKGAMRVNKDLDKAASIEVSLTEGTWELEVTGYADSGRTGAALQGSATIDIASGETTPVTVELSLFGTPGGTGSIIYEIKFPDSTNAGTLIINDYSNDSIYSTIDLFAPDDGNSYFTADSFTTLTGTIDSVPVGYYQALVKLSNTTANLHAGYTELIHVYRNAPTRLTKEFGDEHFLQEPMVDALNLTGLVVTPIKGAAPVISAIDATQYRGNITWKKSDDPTTVTGNFDAATVYKAIVTLTAKEGFSFDGVGANAFSYTGLAQTKVTNSAYDPDPDANPSFNISITIEFPATAAPGLRYVKASPAGLGTGSSWDNASDDLQKMIDQAGADETADTTNSVIAIVRVAAGTYTPRYAPGPEGKSLAETDAAFAANNLTARDKTFILRPGVEIRGGYLAAGEDIDELTRKARFNAAGEPKDEAHRAILSGDIDGIADGGNVWDGFTGIAGNAYHVVLGVDIPNDGTTILDGFTIKGGNNADGSGSITINTDGGNHVIGRYNGGGMSNSFSSPVLTNVVITGNSAYNGGGICNDISSSLVLTNVTITGNFADSGGGGMGNYGSSPVLTNVAMPVLTNVTIMGNFADIGGGMENHSSSPVLTNVTITGNYAKRYGGGMHNYDFASPILTNVTIVGNYALSYSGGGIYDNLSASPKIRNSIVWGNSNGIDESNGSTPEVSYSIVQGGWTGAGSDNLNIDPVFDSPQNYSAAPTTEGDYHLRATSQAINAGDDSYYPDTWVKWEAQIGSGVITQTVYDTHVKPALEKDAGGGDRVKPVTGAIDLGAYEVQSGLAPSVITLTIIDQGAGTFSQGTFTVDRDGTPGAQTQTVTADGLGVNHRWFIDGLETAAGPSITIDAAPLQPGRHFLSLWVVVGGKPWSKNINFTVTD
jgi:hypothetical protein